MKKKNYGVIAIFAVIIIAFSVLLGIHLMGKHQAALQTVEVCAVDDIIVYVKHRNIMYYNY